MKTKLSLISIALAVTAPAYAADSILTAFSQGKTSLDTRLRYENVSDDSTTNHNGGSFTNRLVLGYKTADFNGLTAGIEFENITALIDDDKYNSGTTGEGNKNAAYPVIADPYLTQVNQAYLDYKGLKYGRQKIIFDNARFIGDVGWRQNDQTFDALTYANKTLIPKTQFTVAYMTKVHNIFGLSRDVKSTLVNAKFSPNATTNLTGMAYMFEEETAPTSSWDHAVVRADGSLGGFIYDASFAKQTPYKNGTGVKADYKDLQLGYKFPLLTIKGQYEVLDKGFKTPLATLHAYNGWADRFLNTPANGLEDMNIKVMAPVLGTNVTFAYHQFSAEAVDQDYGQELNLSVAKKFNDSFSGMVKYASYQGETGAAGALGKDVNKLWLQIQYKFM